MLFVTMSRASPITPIRSITREVIDLTTAGEGSGQRNPLFEQPEAVRAGLRVAVVLLLGSMVAATAALQHLHALLDPARRGAAAGQRDSFVLYGTDHPTPDGTCVRDYAHVADLAAARLLAMEAIRPGEYEVYNLGNGSGYSKGQVLDTVREVTGRDFPVHYGPRRPGDPAVCAAVGGKAAARLGWKPQRPDLAAIVSDAWHFHRSVYGD